MKLSIKNKEEVLLGIGLGLGYMTTLRIGLIGPSELMILSVVVLLFIKYNKKILRFSLDIKGAVKGYFFMSIFIVAPLMTIVYSTMSDIERSAPQYLISFMMSWFLTFALVEAIKDGFSMYRVTFWFATVFIFTNAIVLTFFPSMVESSSRFSGAANNPNQLLYYASSLSLLLIMYAKKLAFIYLPIITFIMIKTGSDAYFLTVFVTIVMFLYFKIFFNKRVSFNINIIVNLSILMLILYITVIHYGSDIHDIWLAADQGNARTSLMTNAFIATMYSPLFGLGAGSFSGQVEPFNHWEAHDTFLDFSMQFGFPFAVLLYTIFFVFVFVLIKDKRFFEASFVLGFIVASLFHFTGRHFNFWVELAVFYSYIFHHEKIEKGNHKCVV